MVTCSPSADVTASNWQTLIFKHLPPEITDNECSQFLVGLGATSVHHIGDHGPLKNCAIADFSSSEHAWKVLRSVHQRAILGKRLVVEFYQTSKQPKSITGMNTTSDSAYEIGPWLPVSAPLAPKWDMSLPISSDLCYRYPCPSESILTNIVRVMISCSAFYTQVLHLMNRLHLPPPFGDTDLFPGNLVVVSENALSSSNGVTSIAKEREIIMDDMDLSGSSESELDSSDGDDRQSSDKHKITKNILNRKMLAKKRRKANILPDKVIRMSESHDQTDKKRGSSSKFELHIPQMLPRELQGKERKNQEVNDKELTRGFGHIQPSVTETQPHILLEDIPIPKLPPQIPITPFMDDEFRLRKKPSDNENITTGPQLSGRLSADVSPDEMESEEEDGSLVAYSINDLRLRRLTPEERGNYAVFSRNYTPGDPTSRLYVKNLAPSVTEADLYRVFGAFQYGLISDLNYRPSVNLNSTDRFAVRLLNVGRMKGQAFISLNCELTASQALEATNGLLLHDRPMVVHYARGAKAKVDEKSLDSKM